MEEEDEGGNNEEEEEDEKGRRSVDEASAHCEMTYMYYSLKYK